MQVILIQNVPRVGRKFEVVSVSNGYANNFLFPRKLAEPATKEKIALLSEQIEKQKVKEAEATASLKETLSTLTDKHVTVTCKSDEQGNLYKKIHASDIAESLATEFSVTLPETAILLDKPIDKTGTYTVPVEYGDISLTLSVVVERETK